MECFPIEELIIRKEEGGVQREFLLILLSRPSGEKSWVRLERKRPVGGLGRLADDIAGALIENLILTEPHPTARQLFPGMSICSAFSKH